MRKTKSGFTIVELLIVIVVIAILAAISVVAYTGIQTRATVSAIMSDIKSTEKALKTGMTISGYSLWPSDDEMLAIAGNDNLQDIFDNVPGFRGIVDTAPSSTSGDWEYDNDQNIQAFPCGVVNAGVNIDIEMNNEAMRVALDEKIDDGDGSSCGKFRWVIDSSNSGYYNLSPNGLSGPI